MIRPIAVGVGMLVCGASIAQGLVGNEQRLIMKVVRDFKLDIGSDTNLNEDNWPDVGTPAQQANKRLAVNVTFQCIKQAFTLAPNGSPADLERAWNLCEQAAVATQAHQQSPGNPP
jgi:hypothetical protein